MTAPPAKPDISTATPMIAQFIEINCANPGSLLFYRMGDFYELFFEDAEIASRALGIVLTKRGKHEGQDIRMCGVPIDRADDYLQRLIALGHRVAVCEQMEDPAEAKKRGAKSVVRRAVTRLVTPGTITEERLLEPGRASVMLALARLPAAGGKGQGSAGQESAGKDSFDYGLASIDISTGMFSLSTASQTSLPAQIARIEPREIILPESLHDDRQLRDLLGTACAITPVAQTQGGTASAEQRLCDWYKVASLEGFGQFSPLEIVAAATALAYVEMTQRDARPLLAPPTRTTGAGVMEIDAATRTNLELTRTLSGAREGSLLHAIDHCVTPAGARLLAARLAAPLTAIAAIDARLLSVACLLAHDALRQSLRLALKTMPDVTRALSRLAVERGGPRDLAALRDGLAAARAIHALLAQAKLPPELAAAHATLANCAPGLQTALTAMLADDPPHKARDGGFVRAGHDSALDAARALRDESKRVIAGLQGGYAELAGTRQLRIKHNGFLGYFIEVQQAQGEKMLRPPLSDHFVHRQTMSDAMRFSTAELAGLDARIASAGGEALALELAMFEACCEQALAQADAIRAAADALATIDVTAGLAELASTRGWSRPQVDASFAFEIVKGRHPVVEVALRARGEGFVANGCNLCGADGNGLVAIVTGPNMAGKSTFLRQCALIALLAQTGSYVPAQHARIGVVDRLFSRVGAADDLARGRSTFMVEMVETAAILNQATPHSLVILDEIGRGTATWDGLSIAWAAVEHLHGTNRSRALFATHFHELTRLVQTLPRLTNLTMRVTEHKGEVIFLHEVMAGAADRSYGIQVARLAGLPPTVVARARKLLAELEAAARGGRGPALLSDLPLFAANQPPVPLPDDSLRVALDALDPDALTPRAALEALYALKRERQTEALE